MLRRAVLSVTALIATVAASAVAQSGPEPAVQRPIGFTSYAEFGGTANSERRDLRDRRQPAAYNVWKFFGLGASAYDILPSGQQTVYSRVAHGASATGTKSMSLGKAIQALSPHADGKTEAKKATKQADQDI
jgi:hypothetical protein